jgi:hypothetical protein
LKFSGMVILFSYQGSLLFGCLPVSVGQLS